MVKEVLGPNRVVLPNVNTVVEVNTLATISAGQECCLPSLQEEELLIFKVYCKSKVAASTNNVCTDVAEGKAF